MYRFDQEEVDALLFGLQLVIRQGDPEIVVAASRALDTMAAALANEPVPPGGDVAMPSGPPTADPADTLIRVAHALRLGRKLRILYRDGERQWSRRVVWPVAMSVLDHADMLAAWCELRSDFRHFRLDRIEHAEPLVDLPPTPARVLLAQYRAIEHNRRW